MANSTLQKAFTLIEIIVGVTVIATMMALLLPAIQNGREASRRSSCQGNLRNIGVALQQVIASQNRLPVGARSQPSRLQKQATFGTAWWVEVLPYLEESSLQSDLDVSGPDNGWVFKHQNNGRAVDGVSFSTLKCPSSPLPHLGTVGAFQVAMPSYQGIAGATSDDSFRELRVNDCCSPKYDGKMSSGGVLFANAYATVNDISDGLSRTMAVGETSDFCFTKDGASRRVDGGFPNGWLTGTLAVGTPPEYDLNYARPSWNITTIRYSINTIEYELPGIDDNRGANNPLRSAHSNGVNALRVDGSVNFCTDQIEVVVLKGLVTRDDGTQTLD